MYRILFLVLIGCSAQLPTTPTTPSVQPGTNLQPAEHYAFNGDEYLDKVSRVKGMTIINAKHYLVEIGHTGEVTVAELYQYDANCAQDRVCSYSTVRQTDEELTLWVNRRAAITAP